MSQELALVSPSKGIPMSLDRSEALRKAVGTKVMQIERSIVVNREQKAKQAMGAREAVKVAVQTRIKENTAASRAAESCVRSLDDTVKETGLWITKLHHERYKQFAALSVCERRLQLREGNPPELGKDALQEALELEQKVLNLARKDFLSMETEVKQVVADLDVIRAQLSRDAARRRLAVEADRAVLVTVALASTVAPGAVAIPSAGVESQAQGEPSSPASGNGHAAPDPGSIKESRLLCLTSVQLEDHAAHLRKKAKSSIIRCRDECDRAVKRVMTRLPKLTEQTLEVTKQLITQGKEVDYTLVSAQRSLSANQKFLDAKDRKQGATYQAAENMMAELRRSRSQLSHDLRVKTILLATSEACRKVTPQTASSPPPAALVRPRPSTATGARTRARTGSAMSNNSNSTPNLRPSSPAHLPALVEASPASGPAATRQAEAMPDIFLTDSALGETTQAATSFEGGNTVDSSQDASVSNAAPAVAE